MSHKPPSLLPTYTDVTTNNLAAQLQGAGSADAGGDHGHAHLQRPCLRQREGRGGHQVHLHASGNI